MTRTIDLTLILGKGRVAFLLRSSRPKKFQRKNAKQHQANLQIISSQRENRHEDEEEKDQEDHENHQEQDMRIDARRIY